jgi:hypothetical protein
VVTSIESDCSEQCDVTELTSILKSVHTFNDSSQRRSVQLSVVTSIESDCSVQGFMTERTPIVNSVHTSNESLQKRRVSQRVHLIRKIL